MPSGPSRTDRAVLPPGPPDAMQPDSTLIKVNLMKFALLGILIFGSLGSCMGCGQPARPAARASKPAAVAQVSRSALRTQTAAPETTAQGAGPDHAGGPAPAAKTYRLVGEVRQVNPGSGVVSIHHEEIPGLMGAMTMPFTLKDRALLDDLHPGDEVEGMLRVEWEHAMVKDYELVDLFVTRPVPAFPGDSGPEGKSAGLQPAARRLEPGQMVPDFTMTTSEGRTLALSELRRKVVVITFIYTRCPLPDFCPLMDRKFKELADKIGACPTARRTSGCSR